jgi:hypothetical protein
MELTAFPEDIHPGVSIGGHGVALLDMNVEQSSAVITVAEGSADFAIIPVQVGSVDASYEAQPSTPVA